MQFYYTIIVRGAGSRKLPVQLRPLDASIRGVPSVGFPTGVTESLCGGEGLIRERWWCARGWWMVAVSQEIHRTSFYYCFFIPLIMGIHS